MGDWLEIPKIPVGDGAEAVFDWLQTNASGTFDAMADGLTALIDGLLFAFELLPPVVLIALFAALAWALRRG
ncbi:MAG: choline ABC transporter permease subunit, partial [Pseudomonadota bacterium]